MSYVPIRSVLPSRESCKFSIRSVYALHAKQNVFFQMLYVPIRSVPASHKILKMVYGPRRFASLTHVPFHPTPGPMRPSHLRSYTFPLTFPYVPDGLASMFYTFLEDLCASSNMSPSGLHLCVPIRSCIRSYRFRAASLLSRLQQLILYIPYTFQYAPYMLPILSVCAPAACIRSHALGNKKSRALRASGPARCVG